jgi:FkbH-like protein
MDIRRPTGLIISDFTADLLAQVLANDGHTPCVSATVSPFGQVSQTLLDPSLPCWRSHPDFIFVWTRPESAVPPFQRVRELGPVSDGEITAAVDAFSESLLAAAQRVEYVFVPTWVSPASERGRGMIDLRPGGVARTLLAMNLQLAERLQNQPNVFMLDAGRWLSLIGKNATNPKLWLMGKIAFGNEVIREVSLDLKAALRGLAGQSKKLVLLDLDDTLWGGIVGEVGWGNIVCGGHDPFGEAFVEFQRDLKALSRAGILLGIVSKNDEQTAIEALRSHPEMVLRPDDFAGWRINWEDKAQNIEALVRELNLGLDSVVFIDDSAVERARVREALPQVLVPDWPGDKLLYAAALRSLRCFDKPAITREDASRSRLYVDERLRNEDRQSANSLDAWLFRLDLRVRAERLTANNVKRAVQLLNKTNQMNLATRRMSEKELLAWAQGPGRCTWAISVSDRFGDSGLTGLVSTQIVADQAEIIDYLLSCRVMGRGVEEALLHLAVEEARARGARTVLASYVETARNHPAFAFFETKSGFRTMQPGIFQWNTAASYPLPGHVTLDTVPPEQAPRAEHCQIGKAGFAGADDCLARGGDAV